MTYQEFKASVCDSLRILLPESTTIALQTITRNNDTMLDGLTILENGRNISPTIYLNNYYKSYTEGNTMEVIVADIMKVYEEHKPQSNIDVSFFTDYERVRGRIAFKLVNFEKNRALLKDVPFLHYLDLAIVFYCLISTDEAGSATILIHNHHLDFWKIDVNELYRQACVNTPKLLAAEIKNMESILEEMLKGEDIGLEKADEIPMLVLSNVIKMNGASCILYQGMMEKIAGMFSSDFYILPSSIHEVILVPTGENDSYEELTAMVREVNATQLAREEILSDHVYYYSRNNRQISV